MMFVSLNQSESFCSGSFDLDLVGLNDVKVRLFRGLELKVEVGADRSVGVVHCPILVRLKI